MKNFAKILCILLTLALLVVFAVSCGSDETTETTPAGQEEQAVRPLLKITDKSKTADQSSAVTVAYDTSAYDAAKAAHEAEDEDWAVYDSVFADYYKAYLAAKEQTDVSSKYALMAIAEAKLLESGAFVPTSTQGGTYALTKAAPYTVSSCLWGTDSDRHHNMIVTTTAIKAADRDALKAKYNELKGTGKYEGEAKKYLTDHGYTLKDSFSTSFSADPKTWDILGTYRAADAQFIVDTFDGLLEYDNEGRVIAAIATEVEISEDGLTYTFKLRDDVKWVTKDGAVYANVTANDFVTGMKHLLDIEGGTEYLVRGLIKNVAEYLDGDITDFSQVGVKALDNYTLQYTLEAPTSYFLTMFNYNPFAPANADFLAAEGDDYGTSPDHILYCGPYVITEFTSKNKVVYSANESYYQKDAINIKTVTWIYNDGKDDTKAYINFKEGVTDGCGLTTTRLAMAKADQMDDYIYVSGTNATTFSGFINLNRKSYETVGGFGMESPKTEAQKAETIAALKNKHFRLAFLYAFNRENYNAIEVGADVALYSLRNTYTPGNFVQLTRDVTVKINGVDKTFKKGTYYGEIIQAQLTADGSPIKAWDPTLESGAGSSDGFDGWFNAAKAKEELALAIQELAAQGITVSAENPITIDYPYYSANATYAARSAAFKTNIETVLEGKVVINLIATEDIQGWYYAGYYCDAGEDVNYDMYDVSGWGPDYGDPATYLNTVLPDHGGDMTHVFGLY